MALTTFKVTIKGTRNGLIFLMDDACSLDELLIELKEKMEKSHSQLLSGPPTRVIVKLGNRLLTGELEKELYEIIETKQNLKIDKIESDVITREEAVLERLISQMKLETRTIRSGQILELKGDILLLGDVNPGGCIMATGNIFVLGALRGMAHAGKEGNREAIIAASEMRPTQLRIADMISRSPDEWLDNQNQMEFAYLVRDEMHIDKINQLHRVRPKLRKILEG